MRQQLAREIEEEGIEESRQELNNILIGLL
jgi:hypothetical protein